MLRVPGTQILGREMVEIAARRRTYAVRICLVLLILGIYGLAERLLRRAVGGEHMLGHGPALVNTVLSLMTIAVSVMVPATSVLSVTAEREQGTLVLLVLTPTRMASLVLQKYLTQLLAAGGLCLLGVPLMTVGYALGGMQAHALLVRIAFIAVLICQVAAIGLLAGSVMRSAVSAIVAAYAAVLLIHISSIGLTSGAIPWWYHCSPYMVFVPGRPLEALLLAPAGLALALLALVRVALPWRLEAAAVGRIDRAMKGLDRGLAAVDARMFRLRRSRPLPDAHPVRWREIHGSFFLSWRFMTWCLLPATALMALAAWREGGDGSRITLLCIALTFFLGSLLIAIVSASIVNRERSDQTLEPLLTTNISARDVVGDKMRALARLRNGLLASMVVPLGVVWWCTDDQSGWPSGAYLDGRVHARAWMIAIEIALQLGIYSWMAMMIGMRVRPLSRAVVLSLVAALAFLLAMPVLASVSALSGSSGMGAAGDAWRIAAAACGPLLVILDPAKVSLMDMLLGWLLAACIWGLLAWRCRACARRWLSASVGSS